ncbi:MAG: hypothetical protein AB7V08_08680 [Elusimicrobiales bacterium]
MTSTTTDTPAPEAAAQLTQTERLWKAMRTLRAFTITDLCHYTEVERQPAITFCLKLVRAGLVKRESVTRTKVRGRQPHYRLIKDDGPALPQELRA